MTKKEAIKVLRTESVEIGGNAVSVCRFWEALDMAIAALREQGGKDTNVPTNADRIRAMSDEELLGCLLELQDMAIKRFANFEPPDYQWMADWLQQPAEEGTD